MVQPCEWQPGERLDMAFAGFVYLLSTGCVIAAAAYCITPDADRAYFFTSVAMITGMWAFSISIRWALHQHP